MRRRCFIALVLASAWLGVGQPGRAQGTIAYSQPANPIVLRDEFFGQFYPLDLDGDQQVDITFGYDFHFVGVRADGDSRILLALSPPPNIGGPVAPLPAGFPIGPDSGTGGLAWASRSAFDPFEVLAQCFNTGCGGAFPGQQAYMGIEFQRASGTHYGWVSLYVDSFAPVAVIDSWAWEMRPGVPILAGAVPEPSTFALLVAGGVLMMWFRRNGNAERG